MKVNNSGGGFLGGWCKSTFGVWIAIRVRLQCYPLFTFCTYIYLIVLCLIFTDFNECDLNLDNCHEDALCINTLTHFECRCKPGFLGDGLHCVGKCSSLIPDWKYIILPKQTELTRRQLFIFENYLPGPFLFSPSSTPFRIYHWWFTPIMRHHSSYLMTSALILLSHHSQSSTTFLHCVISNDVGWALELRLNRYTLGLT